METNKIKQERLFFRHGKSAISTIRAFDRETNPYETAIIRKGLIKDKIVVVELYDTYEEAQKGNEFWEKMLLAGQLKPINELKSVIEMHNVYKTKKVNNYDKIVALNKKPRKR